MPTCYPRSQDDTLYAGHPERYPGTDEGDGYPVIRYSEGLEMGYRWFQAHGIEPLFGFGHGLSYTRFHHADLSVATTGSHDTGDLAITARLTVTNTGAVAGREVVQLYVGAPPGRVARPPRELRGFTTVDLEPGEYALICFIPDDKDGKPHVAHGMISQITVE